MNNTYLNLISYNVRGLNNSKKRRTIFTYLKSHSCDIALLQETFSSEEEENKWSGEWEGKCIYLHGTKHSKGMAIMIRKGLNVEILKEESDKNSRFMYIKIRIDENIIHIFNVYAPNKEPDQLVFINTLKAMITNQNITSSDCCIFGGDWNLIQNTILDKNGGTNVSTKKKYHARLSELLEEYELLDIWRKRNGIKQRYTWRQKSPRIQCRLDYFLITQSLEVITNSQILPSILSDHSPVTLEIQLLNKAKLGPGHWKLNVSVLEEDKYINAVKEKITELEHLYKDMANKNLKWELYKYEIRKLSIQYCKKKKKTHQDVKLQKESELTDLLKFENDNNEDFQKQIEVLQDELEEIYKVESEGAKVRSRTKWFEEGERNTTYFYNLEKVNQAKKNIRKLVINENEITMQTEILNELHTFYKNLYTEQPTTDDSHGFFTAENIPKLDNIEQQICEGMITENECSEVLKTFKGNKSPGNDGLPIEFYTVFWQDIKQTLIESYNYSFENGTLTNSQRQAIITLIDKPDKDRRFIENWRPISLLNMDYKILTKCLSYRMTKVLNKLIHHSQFGFLKGRNINDALLTILDIVEHLDLKDKPGIMLAIDFQKAFDTLSWNYMLKTLETFNFGNEFIKWITICYTEISSCVINYGYASQYFDIKRGVRQGDPLSPYLFILALEILCINIRNDNNIKGINIMEVEIKTITFADDTTILLQDIESAKKLLRLLQYYEQLSGLRINRNKSEGLWLGSNKNLNIKPLGLKWRKTIKLLGIHISYDKNEIISKNFDAKISRIKQQLNMWRCRDLTIFGKVLLIKTFALSHILHITSVLDTPDEFIKEFEQIIYKFLWNGKQYKVKKNVCIQNKNMGGIGMISLKEIIKTQRIKLIKDYFNDKYEYWKSTMTNIMLPYHLNILLLSNFNIPENATPFYKSVFSAFKEVKLNKIGDKEDIENQCIWYNENITLPFSANQIGKLIDKGLVTITNLINDNGDFKTWDVLKQEFDLSQNDFIVYHSIKLAIPSEWRNTLKVKANKCKSENELKIQLNHNEYTLRNINTKFLYLEMVKEKYEVSKAQYDYSKKFDIKDEDFFHYHSLYMNLNIVNKVKETQYKIVHNYIANNRILYKMNLLNSPRCNFCQLYSQDTSHLFLECLEVKNFWYKVNKWLQEEQGIQLDLNLKNIILGNVEMSQYLTKILLYAKSFIYICKNKYRFPKIDNFKRWLSKFPN